jgi:hypothetical protein
MINLVRHRSILDVMSKLTSPRAESTGGEQGGNQLWVHRHRGGKAVDPP